MNGRFVELAYQSKLFDGTGSVPFKDVEKFAELIVKECADRIKNADMTDLEGSDPDDVLWLVERQIVKHFGVEE